MFIKYYDQSIAYNLLLKYGLELTLFKVKFLILLLFWVGGGWVGEIDIKDQLSPTEVEIRTEFGNICGVFLAAITATIS